jgi:DHA1 family tetracycline resistance protein-like MFS transporter
MIQTSKIKPAVWIALFLDAAAFSVAVPIIPKLIEGLVHGNIPFAASCYGVLLAISGLLLFFLGPVQACLADQFGRKKMLIASAIGSAISFIALAFSPNLFFLFFAQVIYAATGASQPVATCYIAEQSNSDQRAKNFATLSGVCTSGFVIGASLGGLLGQFSLHLAMIIAALIGAAAALLMWVSFEETIEVGKQNRLALKLLGANPITSSKFLFSKATLAEFAFIMICGDFAFQAFLSTWVLFTTLRFHWTISQAGASLALEGLLSVVVQLIVLRFALPRLGVRKTLLAALAFDALALLLYNGIDGSLFVVFVIALHCIGAAVRPACTAALSASVTAGEQSKLQGAIASQYALSSVVATLLGTSLFSYFTSSVAPISLPGISMLVGFFALVAAMIVAALPYGTALIARNSGGTHVLQPAKVRAKVS